MNKNRYLKFKGIDSFNRPVYEVEEQKSFVGSTSKLFSLDATKEEVDTYFKEHPEELVYFGSYFGCEPYGFELRHDRNFVIT